MGSTSTYRSKSKSKIVIVILTLIAAIAIALSIAVIVKNGTLTAENESLQSQIENLQSQNESLQLENESLQSQIESNSSTTPTEPEDSNTSSPIEQPSISYFVIEEWNIKFRIPEGLDSPMYSIGEYGNVDITTAALSGFPHCSSLGVLSRAENEGLVTGPGGGQMWKPAYYNFDGYFYFYTSPQAVCSSDPDTEVEIIRLIREMLTVPFEKV